MSNLHHYSYRINSEDQIVYVNREWLQFAKENDAPDLTESTVLGTKIWRYVKGDETRRLYSELFFNLRNNKKELTLPFNCDSPHLIRNMILTLRALGSGSIELECRLSSVQKREYVGIFDSRVERTDYFVRICSICRKFHVDGEWLSVTDVLGRKRWFTSVPLPQLEESLCSSCECMPGNDF
jgi:hypothetical protein